MAARRPVSAPASPASVAEDPTGLHIARYHASRHFALYDGTALLAVTVYKKGAEALKTRLEADAKTIADLTAQVQALTPRFRERITQTPYRPPVQLPLIAAEDIPAYRRSAPGHP